MKFINKKIIVLVLFVVVITTFMCWKNINNEDKLEVVRLKNNNDTNMFAIMLEQSYGTYTLVDPIEVAKKECCNNNAFFFYW